MMKEDLLHYVWKTRNFNSQNLETTDKKSIEIKSLGFHNNHSGPDFLQAQLKLDNQWWFGHVEIHIKSSDWIKHEHHKDFSYENVILHVVFEHDVEIYRTDGTVIPTLELKDRIPEHLIESYHLIMNQQSWVPCEYYMSANTLTEFYFQRHKLYVEKLEKQSVVLLAELKRNGKDWDQLLWFAISRSFGLKVNADAMMELSMKVPIKLIWKHSFNPIQLEAILFGQAGVLSSTANSNHVASLQKEYAFLQQKYQLKPMTGREWKFMRMRPSAFPTLRLALLASLYAKGNQLHQRLLHFQSLDDLYDALEATAGTFWDNHFTLFKKSQKYSPKTISKQLKNLIIINGFIPYLFTLGQYNSDNQMVEKAIELAQFLPPENNHVIKKWKTLGVEIENAYDSQAFLHLKKIYCNHQLCLKCQYGNKVLNSIGKIIQESKDKLTA